MTILDDNKNERAIIALDYERNHSNNFDHNDYNEINNNDNYHSSQYYLEKELKLREILLFVDSDEIKRIVEMKKHEIDLEIKAEIHSIKQKLDNKINDVDIERQAVNNAGVSGLKNLGNTCYLNSVLQCLNNTPFFNIFICQGDFYPSLDNYLHKKVIAEIEQENKNSNSNSNSISTTGTFYIDENTLRQKKSQLEKQSICINLRNIFIELWKKNQLIVPLSFREAVKQFGELFASNDQNDCQEFLGKIFEAIHEETVHEDPQVAKNMADKFQQCKLLFKENVPFKSCYDVISQYWMNYREKNISIITELFTGLTSTVIKCHNCNNYSIRYEPLNCLTLHIPNKESLHDSDKELDLSDLFKVWSAKEFLIEDNKYQCTPCNSLQDAEKFNSIILPPKILVIHLGRFFFDEDEQGNLIKNKIKTKINFPITNLRLNEMYFLNYNMSFIHNDVPSTANCDNYDLWCVIEHQGSNMNCGHYICYCKNFENGLWYKFNDEHPHYIGANNIDIEKTIISEGSYLLFYALKQN